MSNKDKRVKRDLKTKTWYYVVDLPPKNGKRQQVRRRGFATSKEANDDLKQVLAAGPGGPVPGARGGLTLGQFLDQRWLPSLPGQDIRPTTRDSYSRITRGHLIPQLGETKLTELDAAAIEALSGKLADAGLSPKTRRNILGVLSKALADARRWGLLGANSATGAKLPRATRPVPRAWSAAQLAQFLDHVRGDRLAAMWRFTALTGCRRGEVCGLRWGDLDLDAGTATITNQRTMAAGHVVEGPVKTASGARTVALDPATVAALRKWRQIQRQEFVRLGVRPSTAYVFTSEAGTPVWPQRVTSRFRALCDEAGLPQIGPHGLRHSAATWLLSSGANPKLVAQRLGHASPAITVAVYSHVMPGHDEAAAAAFAAALSDAQKESECDHGVTTDEV